MHDVLHYAARDPVHRRWNHNELTFSMIYAYTENFILPFSHDEVVHGKRSMLDKLPGDEWQKRATLRTLFAFMFLHPGKKLLFMGVEFGQWREWNHDTSLDWHLLEYPGHVGLQRVVKDLNRLYRAEPALHRRDHHLDGFRWIDCSDNENSVVSVLRTAADPADHFVAVFNFTPVPATAIPSACRPPASTAKCSIPTVRCTVEAASATLAGWMRCRAARTDTTSSCPLTVPPLGAVLLAPARVPDVRSRVNRDELRESHDEHDTAADQ